MWRPQNLPLNHYSRHQRRQCLLSRNSSQIPLILRVFPWDHLPYWKSLPVDDVDCALSGKNNIKQRKALKWTDVWIHWGRTRKNSPFVLTYVTRSAGCWRSFPQKKTNQTKSDQNKPTQTPRTPETDIWKLHYKWWPPDFASECLLYNYKQFSSCDKSRAKCVFYCSL